MAALRLFAAARVAAGTGSAEFDGATVGEVIELANQQFGPDFQLVANQCAVWLNGESAEGSAAVGAGDEVALLPPVSGGAASADGTRRD